MPLKKSQIPKRKRNNLKYQFSFFYNDKDIRHLFLKTSQNLSNKEKNTICDFYNYNNKSDLKLAFKKEKILPFAAHVLMDLNLDYEFWSKIHRKFVVRNTQIKLLVNNIFKEFEKNNCNSVVLTENFAVILSSNSDVGDFSSGDVDMYANLDEKDNIRRVLNKFDFFSNEQPDKIGEYSGQSMQFNNKEFLNGFWINIIWKPVTRAFLVQDKYEKRLKKELLNYKKIKQTNIKVLSDNALVYFCALHISAGHYYTLSPGLRLYVDIDRMCALNIDWEKIKLWEAEDNAGIRISFALLICNKIFKSKIPVNIFSNCLINYRNKSFFNYLYNEKYNETNTTSNIVHRLYVELLSDDKPIIISLINRLIKYFIKT